MNTVSRTARAVTHPARTAGSVAGMTLGLTLGAAKVGLRTTARVVGWAVERAGGPTPRHPSETYPAVVVPLPDAAPDPADEAPDPATVAAPAPEAATDTAPARKAATTKAPTKKAPAKKAPTKKAAAKKAAAKKTAAKKTAAKKTAKKAPSAKAAVLAPALGLSEDEVVEDDLRTPSGIPAAGEGVNPDTTETDLLQRDTEPLMDPATVKAAAKEHTRMQRAAEPDKG